MQIWVPVDGVSYPLPKPFFVIATQNPSESHGVYPLTDSQLDRFTLNVPMTLPNTDQEWKIFQNILEPSKLIEKLTLVELGKLKELVESIHLDSVVLKYIHIIVQKTREDDRITSGISVRGALQFIKATKALAFVQGQDFVTPMEVQELAVFVLAHRIQLKFDSDDLKIKREIISEIVKKTPCPK